MLIMKEDKDVELGLSQGALEPEAGDTIVCFACAEPASGRVDAPAG